MKFIRFFPIVLLLFISLGFLFSLTFNHASVQAQTTHAVISEIQLTGGTGQTNNEFIELYNPTGSDISLTNWRLTRKTATGTESDLIATMSGTIVSHGYFLIANAAYTGSVTPDATYSTNAISANNTILLYNDAAVVVDKVGFGTATDKETTAIASNPGANHSVERKANSASTVTSMIAGGSDEFAGNGEDTDNNAADFIERTLPDPQNSHSPLEPSTPTNAPSPIETLSPTVTETPTITMTPTVTPNLTPSPTVTPTETITMTPLPTLSVAPTEMPSPTITPTEMPIATPTITPTNTPMPTITPTSTSTPEPTVTPTNVPTPIMTVMPSPTLSTSPTPMISQTPTPTSIGQQFPFHNLQLVCSWKTQVISFGNFHISIPFFSCIFEER